MFQSVSGAYRVASKGSKEFLCFVKVAGPGVSERNGDYQRNSGDLLARRILGNPESSAGIRRVIGHCRGGFRRDSLRGGMFRGVAEGPGSFHGYP